MWRRRDYTYESAHSTDSRRNLDHNVTYEPEPWRAWADIPALCYGQRSEWSDNERGQRVVGYVRCICRDCVFYWSSDCSRNWHGDCHGNFWLSQSNYTCQCDSGGYISHTDTEYAEFCITR
jgi:hypothetical protein